jgi:SAM-dependent methyltransferase
LIVTISPVYPFADSRTLRRLLKQYSSSLMVNVGSGAHRIHPKIVNVDFQAFAEVDIIADATCLPFRSDSVDLLVSIALLEHVKEPRQVISEFFRVLKPGGVCLVSVPFIQGFHASPHDYQRYTAPGLVHQFKEFDEIELNSVGPTSAVVWILGEWFGTLFCLGSKRLQVILSLAFTIALSPLKFLDYFLRRLPGGENISTAFTLAGKKPLKSSFS